MNTFTVTLVIHSKKNLSRKQIINKLENMIMTNFAWDRFTIKSIKSMPEEEYEFTEKTLDDAIELFSRPWVDENGEVLK